MRKRMLIPTLAATLSLLVGACEDTDDVAGVAEGDGTDPAGVQLARYGVTEPPCDGEQHLATVVTEESAYNAFCADAGGRTSVFVMSRAGAEVEVNATTALEHFLAITPDDVAVPEILEHAAESKSGRELTREIVKYVDPRAGPANGSTSLATTIGFSTGSQASFEANQCSKIEDWIDGGNFFKTHQWCSGLLGGGSSQRTASVQGVQQPDEGRIRVRAYDNTVRVRAYYKNPFNGNWWNGKNYTTQPGHLMVWKTFFSDAKWCQGAGELRICQHASDLRFRVEPSAGAKFRYTGGFVDYAPPVG